jgi:shikimate dehydrogenase
MKLFGLIGYPLSHSFSKKYFSDKFAREHVTDCRYELFPLAEIGELPALLDSEPDLRGLNVTIPYKQQVIPFLHGSDDVVQQTGACNCIRIRDGRLEGFNTDVTGFEVSLKWKLAPVHDRALVLGSGGAAQAVIHVLRKLGIPFLQVSRKPSPGMIDYASLTAEMVRATRLIVNTTPLGMYPDIGDCPDIPYEALGPDHYLYDLVYNPAKTRFLGKGEERGATIANGAAMLEIQAEESWRIWDDKD